MIEMTKDAWLDMGTGLFGPNTDLWKFVCPSCGTIAAVGDFRKYAAHGAHPSSATCECIGRYEGATRAFNPGTFKPCNYAGYGLLRLSPVTVLDGDKRITCFAFEGQAL